MADVVYRCETVIERTKGPVRHARIPGESQPVVLGVHGAIAEHYGRAPGTYEPHAATIDYVISAAAG